MNRDLKQHGFILRPARVAAGVASLAFALGLATSPALAANPATGSTPAGQALNISIDSPSDGATVPNGSIKVAGRAAIGSLNRNANVIYTIDNSGSTAARVGDCNGSGTVDATDDINGDGQVGTILDCELAGTIALNTSLAGASGVSGGIVGFASGAEVLDVGPAAGDQAATGTAIDANTAGGRDLEEVMRSITGSGAALFTTRSFGGGTNFNAALTRSNEALDGRSGANVIFFLSDGQASLSSDPSSPLAVAASRGTTINTFAVGNATSGCASGAPLRVMADQTGGTCTEVTDPTTLAGAFDGIRPANIAKIEVARSNDAVVTASIDALGNWTATVPGIVPGSNPLTATVTANDGTKVTASISVNGTSPAGGAGANLVKVTVTVRPVGSVTATAIPCSQAQRLPVLKAVACPLVSAALGVRLG